MRSGYEHSPMQAHEVGRSASRLEEEGMPFKIGEVSKTRAQMPRESSKEALMRLGSETVLEESMKEEKKQKYAHELKQQVSRCP